MAKILIVDDAIYMRTVIRNALESAGHEIVGEATTGMEAVKAYRELHPEMVIMDITMPDMDGVTSVKFIREMDPEAVIIMCSAAGEHILMYDAMKAGAKDFIVKPFQTERLVQVVNHHAAIDIKNKKQ